MERSVALNFLESRFAEIAQNFDVSRLAIFGSTARDEANDTSDLDVLVEFKGPPKFDSFMDLTHYLEQQLAVKIDLVPLKSLRKEFKASVLEEAIFIPLNKSHPIINLGTHPMKRKNIRKWNLYVNDMIEACQKIHKYADAIGFEQFVDDELIYDAICRNIEIIGEAAKHVPPDIMALLPEIPWVKLVDTRNHVSHGYFSKNFAMIWDIAQTHAPELLIRLEKFKLERSDLFSAQTA